MIEELKRIIAWVFVASGTLLFLVPVGNSIYIVCGGLTELMHCIDITSFIQNSIVDRIVANAHLLGIGVGELVGGVIYLWKHRDPKEMN